jgi:hypothetical protein
VGATRITPRPGAVGRVIFRHVQREAAAAARFIGMVRDAGVRLRRRRETRQQAGVVAQGGIDEEFRDRRQARGERIQCFLGARRMTQRAKRRNQLAIAMLHRAQSLEGGKRRIARSGQCRLDVGELPGPVHKTRPDGPQRLVGHAGRRHHRLEIRRIEMAGDEAKRFKRLQQRRQYGHDVVHHRLAHRALALG